MSLLERWVANTKRVLAKDKNTETEYEFESVFPDGTPDGTAFSAENMNKIIDAVNGLDESKGQPGGIATLDGSGKLAQKQSADILWSGELTSTSAAPSTVTLSNSINQYRLVAVVTALGSSISSYRLLNLYDCMTMGQASQRIRYNDASAVVTSTMRWRSGGDYTKVQFDAIPTGWVVTHVIGYH